MNNPDNDVTMGTPLSAMMMGGSSKSQEAQQLQQMQLAQQAQLQQMQYQLMQQQELINNKKNNISNLVSDINKSLDEHPPTPKKRHEKRRKDKREEQNQETTEEEKDVDQGQGLIAGIPMWIKEMILLITIYFILSIGFVKNTIGNYIRYVNINPDGSVSFIGILIYGLIIAGLFILSRTMISKIN